MVEKDLEKLLSDKRVIAEIKRHLWLESEKKGYDIGYEHAKEDWLKKFSKAWMEYHMPEEVKIFKKNLPPKASKNASSKKAGSSNITSIKRRRVKTHYHKS